MPLQPRQLNLNTSIRLQLRRKNIQHPIIDLNFPQEYVMRNGNTAIITRYDYVPPRYLVKSNIGVCYDWPFEEQYWTSDGKLNKNKEEHNWDIVATIDEVKLLMKKYK